MPKRERGDERTERRVVRRRARATARASYPTMPRAIHSLPLTGFANSKMVKLRYAEQIALNPGVNGIASWTFSANGMYDPNVTGVGHQPSGFDQNMLFYDHYTVIAAKCRVRHVATTTSNIMPAYFDVIISDDGITASSFTSPEDFVESRFADGMNMRTAGTERNYYGINPYVTKDFNAKRFFRKNALVGDSQYKGSASANPSEQAYFEVIASSIAGNDPASITFLVVIDYVAVLTEPKNIAQS